MRTFISYLIVVFPCFIVSSLQAEVTTDVSKIQEICSQAIENRLKIKQWHVKLDRINTGLRAEHGSIVATSFYVDGNRKRVDSVFLLPEGTTREQFSIQNDEYYFSYQKYDNKINPNLALYQVENKSKYAPKDAFTADFRVLGFVPRNFGVGKDPIRSHLGYMGKIEDATVSMSDEMLNGIPCKKILSERLEKGKPDHCAIWIAPDYGYTPIRIESKTDAYRLFDYTTVEVARYKDTDIWVPMKVVSERQMNGQVERTEYTTTVYSINEPIDAKWFSPESLGLPPGTPVAMPAENPMMSVSHVWDGKKTVSEGEMLLEQATNRRVSGYRYGLFAAGLALISLALLLKYFEAGRKEG